MSGLRSGSFASRNHAKLLLTFKNFLTVRIPALVEFPCIDRSNTVYLVRACVRQRIVEEERLVRSGLLLAIDIEDCLIGDLVTQMTAIGRTCA